jgi:hypothetical protein
LLDFSASFDGEDVGLPLPFQSMPVKADAKPYFDDFIKGFAARYSTQGRAMGSGLINLRIAVVCVYFVRIYVQAEPAFPSITNPHISELRKTKVNWVRSNGAISGRIIQEMRLDSRRDFILSAS